MLAASGRRNSLTMGMNSSANFFLNKSTTFEQNQSEQPTDEKNPIPLMDVHCYRSAAFHPNMQRINSRYTFGKPF